MTEEEYDTLYEMVDRLKYTVSDYRSMVYQEIVDFDDRFQELAEDMNHFMLSQSYTKEEVKDKPKENLADQVDNVGLPEAVVMIMEKLEKISEDFNSRLTRLEQGR